MLLRNVNLWEDGSYSTEHEQVLSVHSHIKLSLELVWAIFIDSKKDIYGPSLYFFTEETMSWPNNNQHMEFSVEVTVTFGVWIFQVSQCCWA